MNDHRLHCDKDADFQNCLCAEEQIEEAAEMIQAADALAKAAGQLASNLPDGCGCSQLCDHHSHWNSEALSALAAYEKTRGI